MYALVDANEFDIELAPAECHNLQRVIVTDAISGHSDHYRKRSILSGIREQGDRAD